MRPRVFFMKAQTVLTPGGKHAAAEAVGKSGDLARLLAQNIAQAVHRLVPGANQLGIVHAAMLGLGRLFVRGDQPEGEIIVGSVGHAVDVIEDALGILLQIVLFVSHRALLFLRARARISTSLL